MSKPTIKTIGGKICTYCPFCGDLIYEREPGDNAELSCQNTFELHAPSCKKNPDYVETEMDLLKKKIFGDSN